MRLCSVLGMTSMTSMARSAEQALEVTLPHGGRLRGRVVQQNASPAFQAFLGVPYARPPLGELRFMPPQPAEPWTGVRDAVEERPPALQIDYYLKKVLGSEDCLYLNVYRPASTRSDAKKPVLVYFHYGMWSLNNSSMNEVGPELFVSKDIIMVVINYRLLAFGFMSLNTPLAPGNMGLKDAVLGVRWVRENIAAFGGDPERVTLFGFCIGAYIAHLLHFVEEVKGSFQRSMLFSGSLLSTWFGAVPGEVVRERTLKLARLLGCEATEDEQVFKFLQSVPAFELFSKSWHCMDDPPPSDRANPPFLPIIDTQCSPQPLFPAHPTKMVRDGMNVSAVPTMFSMARDDGQVIRGDVKLWTGMRVDESNLQERYRNKLERTLPWDLDLELGSPEREEVTREVRKFYFDDTAHPSMYQMYTYLGDVTCNKTVIQAARHHACQPEAPATYLLSFSVESDFNRSKAKYGSCIVPGLVVHADDLGYYFGAGREPQGPGPEPVLEYHSVEAKTRRRFMALLANFIKYGNPTPENEPELDIHGLRWPRLPHTLVAPYPSLDLGVHPAVQFELHGPRMRFWENIYERYFTDGDTLVSRRPPTFEDVGKPREAKVFSKGIIFNS